MRRGLFVLFLLTILTGCRSKEITASIHGAEWESLVLQDVEYIRDASDQYQSYGASDKGSYLGKAESGETVFRIYSIRDDTENNYLYVQWGHEGEIYVRKSLTENNEVR